MNPGYQIAQQIKKPEERSLATLDDDEKYLIIREDIPKQLLSQGQKESLE